MICLGNDGAQSYLPPIHLSSRWAIGERVKVTIERIKKPVCRKKPGIVLIGS